MSGNLLSRMEDDRKEIYKEKKKNEKRKQKGGEKKVRYNSSGKAIRGSMKTYQKVLLIILFIIALIVVLIYVPPFFYKEKSNNSYVPITPDATAIKMYQTYLKDSPDLDFDDDGLSNTLEDNYGTDVWNIDTDNDAVSDYAELFVTETSPKESTTILAKEMMAEDKKNGDSLSTPYKIDDIIFWPDDYYSKAYGAVVRTANGYRFCNYKGWVKFPQKVYAYGYQDGIHFELPHREEEDVWKIDSSYEVVLYGSPLTFVHCLNLPFIGTLYFDDGGFGSFLTKVLPNKGGFVNCHKAAVVDTEPDTSEPVVADLRSPYIKKDDYSRLGKNTNTLKDLTWVYKMVDANECVAVSLYSGNVGEAIGIIYGYTQSGDLLVANESLEPVGTIYISENAKRMMNKDGVIGQIMWFEWEGLGFDSRRYNDRISFFSSTITDQTDYTDASTTQTAETEAEGGTDDTSNVIPDDTDASNVIPDDTDTSNVIPDDTDTSNVIPDDTATDNTAQGNDTQQTQATDTGEAQPETPNPDDLITFGF